MTHPLGTIESFVAGATARAMSEVEKLGEFRTTPSFKDMEAAIAGAFTHFAELIGLESEAAPVDGVETETLPADATEAETPPAPSSEAASPIEPALEPEPETSPEPANDAAGG